MNNKELQERMEKAMESEFCTRLSKQCELMGYDLIVCWKLSDDGNYRVSLEPIGIYSPDLYVEPNADGKGADVSMGTTTYGTLSEEEAMDFSTDIQKAVSLMSVLGNMDWTECPIL